MTTTTYDAQQLGELAERLELEVCADRLLTHLFGEDGESTDRPGRHRVLEDAIGGHQRLRADLLAGDRDAVLDAWRACLMDHTADVRLHHAVAVVYRERAFARAASTDTLVLAAALWAILLATRSFWRRQRRTRDPATWRTEEPKLLLATARELFALHASRGAQELAAGRPDLASRHLGCLTACAAGATEIIRLLDTHHIPYRSGLDPLLMAQVSALAAYTLDEWAAGVVADAERRLDDPAAVSRLPHGISRNFEDGLRRLEAFARLAEPPVRVLRTGLEWYVDWWYCLYHRHERDRIRELVESASVLADHLAPHCTPGSGAVPENRALSLYHMFRGFAAEDPDVAEAEYRTALAWNPDNHNAQTLLDDTQRAQVNVRIRNGQEALSTLRFRDAQQHFEAARRASADGDDRELALERLDIAVAAGRFVTACEQHNPVEIVRLRQGLAHATSTVRKDVAGHLNKYAVKQVNDLSPASALFDEKRQLACRLLRTAIELDPSLDAARGNLEALRCRDQDAQGGAG